MQPVLVFLLGVLAWSGFRGAPLSAQSRDNAAFVLDLPAGTRALGLGTLINLAEGDNDAVFSQPAVLDRSAGVGISVQRYRSRATLTSVSAVTEWAGGGLGIGLQSLTYGTGSADPAAVSLDEGALLAGGPTAASEMVATAAYGREVLGFRVGAAVKAVEQRVGSDRDATVAFDAGITRDVGVVTLGLAANHLGPGLNVNGIARPIPHRGTASMALRRRPVGPFDVGGVAAVRLLRDGSVVPAAGLEISYWPISGRTFTGRIGVRRIPTGTGRPVTIGFGFTGDRITIEYAFQDFDGSGAAHRVGLRWR